MKRVRLARTIGNKSRNLVMQILPAMVALLCCGCATPPAYQINLMPAPDVYGDGMLNLLPENDPFEALSYDGILFATDRIPASEKDKEAHYVNKAGYALRVGNAKIQFGEAGFSWERAREISLLKSRVDHFPVKIARVEEWGVIADTIPFWINLDLIPEELRPVDATKRFAEAVNNQLSNATRKDVYIYTHGYMATYENPVLVSAELWHFLGYSGVFLAYSWPSTPSRYAYIRDTDISVGFARNLRLLIELIAEQPEVERIHIIGYSNGTRLVIRAMEQLAIKNRGLSNEQIHEKLKIQNVVLIGSDLDRKAFGAYVADGIVDLAHHLTVYVSAHDKALGFSRFLTRRERLGQMWGGKGGEMNAVDRYALEILSDKVSFVNVSEAEGATTGKGHGYFRSSPWASSDLLMTLYYGLNPIERGLIRNGESPVYEFPKDYILRLWTAIEKKDPDFAENYRRLRNIAP